MKLENKVVMVTGGARGIGLSATRSFLDEGASVAVLDFDISMSVALQQELGAGEKLAFYATDVSDRSSVDKTVQDILTKYGRIDILVNNAGITRDSMLTKMTAEQWNTVIAVNLTGVFNCTQAVLPTMIQQGSGRIINTSSVVGVYGNIGQTNYAATKAGIIGMTKTWAKELGRKGITCNAVAPGFIMTDMTASLPEKVLGNMKANIPLGRLGTAEDIAKVYLFLASDQASYVNGAIIPVDGGLF